MILNACPYTSWINRPDELPDILRHPTLAKGRLTGILFFFPCTEGCPICGQVEVTLGEKDEQNVIDGWEIARSNTSVANGLAAKCQQTIFELLRREDFEGRRLKSLQEKFQKFSSSFETKS